MNNKLTTTTMLPGMFNDIFEQHFSIKPASNKASIEVIVIDDEEAYEGLEGCECEKCGVLLHSWDIDGIEQRGRENGIYCEECAEY